ncbi:MAG: DUF4276 family protein, partial [Gemmatimonadetes bacterium]|nr:DUF4276 family protein [Gemmatimonadota bacterium]
RVKVLDDGLGEDISDRRFIPHFQLHEFEALLLSDPQKLDAQFDRSTGIRRLVDMVASFDSPELINDGNDTSPSKRIIGEIPEYERMKVSAAPIVADKIGLPTLRLKCKHFGEWICKLETLNKGERNNANGRTDRPPPTPRLLGHRFAQRQYRRPDPSGHVYRRHTAHGLPSTRRGCRLFASVPVARRRRAARLAQGARRRAGRGVFRR